MSGGQRRRDRGSRRGLNEAAYNSGGVVEGAAPEAVSQPPAPN